jgi:hypothetical protein
MRALATVSFLCVLAASHPVLAQDAPLPPVITALSGAAPSDAIVLFDGSNLAAWTHQNGTPVRWTIENKELVVQPGTGVIVTKQTFHDMQLHLEFATPKAVSGNGQERGNSGIFLHGIYEIQVLDSYQNDTYARGMCGALYGQYPPLVNASRAPGEWQSFDIILHGPVFDTLGNISRRATLTAFHNGILIHDHVEIMPTRWGIRNALPTHNADGMLIQGEKPEGGPLMIQDHQNNVRFRNIWVRELTSTAVPK